MSGLRSQLWRLSAILLFIYSLPSISTGQANRPSERILIETPKPYDGVVAAIQAQGGRVTRQFKNVDAIAAEIPADRVAAVRALTGFAPMSKDIEIPVPAAAPAGHERPVGGNLASPVTGVTAASVGPASSPAVFSLNNAGTNIEQLRALHPELTGEGTIVAVIDGGVRPGFPLLESDGSVIGGEDFVGDNQGFSNKKNDGHGTFVAGMISGNAEFSVSGKLLDAIQAYAPNALTPAGKLPIVGSAPSSKIYAMRVFADPQVGAQLSAILAAIDRVITLRKDYLSGAGGLKIDVCNLSFGRSTRDAGHSVLEKAFDALAAAGIVAVAPAGDAGPSSLTISSPGSAFNALTVGGFSRAANERIQRDLVFGRGSGLLYRPRPETQTYVFSSRGPDADGRIDPDVVASAVENIGQGYCPSQSKSAEACSGDITIASGTSFSAPIVAGIAAVLRQAFPNASAYQIRNALIATANPSLIEDGSTEIDRGRGAPDAVAAYNLLKTGNVPDGPAPTPSPNPQVAVNVALNTTLVVRSGAVTEHVRNLRPGQRSDILFNVPFGTGHVIVKVENITTSAAAPNQIFGDGVSVDIHSAKTSAINGGGDYLTNALPRTGQSSSFDLTKLDTGLLRVTVSGDTVNAGNVSADVTLSALPEALSAVTAKGPIQHLQQIPVAIQIPRGASTADFLLSWTDDWSHYPTSDLDLRLFPPGCSQAACSIITGATLASPERASLVNPAPGTWTAVVDGFDIPQGVDFFELRVLIDGAAVK